MIKVALIFLFAVSINAQVNYAYKREVTVESEGHTVTRTSTFTFDDHLRRVERDVVMVGHLKLDWPSLRDPEILSGNAQPSTGGDIWTNVHLRYAVWRAAPGALFYLLPQWNEAKGMVKGKWITLRIRYYDYKEFRAALVSVREVE
jgi:hypothetical protein